ncbi:hypothetical protein C3L33_15611, partial [Rhododendron williamsianum]
MGRFVPQGSLGIALSVFKMAIITWPPHVWVQNSTFSYTFSLVLEVLFPFVKNSEILHGIKAARQKSDDLRVVNRDTGVTMPPFLAFLVSNFHTLVKIQLGSDNYLLWKTQVLNALRANGFIGYVDAYLRWQLIDNQLLLCLTASLSASTLPLVLGLEHAYETGTIEQYIDEIKLCAQKLGAVGYMVDDDDLNGLPEIFDPVKFAIGAHRDLKFHELVSILKAEEIRLHKSKGNPVLLVCLLPLKSYKISMLLVQVILLKGL